MNEMQFSLQISNNETMNFIFVKKKESCQLLILWK